MQYRLDWEYNGPRLSQMYITKLTEELPLNALNSISGEIDKKASVVVSASSLRYGMYKARGLLSRSMYEWINTLSTLPEREDAINGIFADFQDCSSGLWRHICSHEEADNAKFTQ